MDHTGFTLPVCRHWSKRDWRLIVIFLTDDFHCSLNQIIPYLNTLSTTAWLNKNIIFYSTPYRRNLCKKTFSVEVEDIPSQHEYSRLKYYQHGHQDTYRTGLFCDWLVVYHHWSLGSKIISSVFCTFNNKWHQQTELTHPCGAPVLTIDPLSSVCSKWVIPLGLTFSKFLN